VIRPLVVILLLATSIAAAQAFGLGLGNRFGRLGASSQGGGVTPPPSGDILLVDGTSLILQTDGASLICIAGGC
jgi:hypothetical protein